jgi:tripartite ATP-independent transporter DctP family solute receptor
MPVLLRSLCAAVLLIWASQASAQVRLRIAHTTSTTDTQHLAALKMKEIVEAQTKGKVVISVHPAGELGNDPALLEGVRLGTIDIAYTGNPFFTRFEPKLNALDLPYIFKNREHVYRVLDGPIGQQLLASLEKHRMKPLAFWEIGFRHLTNSKHAVKTPKDMEGLKIRTTPNPAHVLAFKLLGAIPTPMPFTEVYMALETHAVDGQENPVYLITANRLHEVQKFMSLTGHAYTTAIVTMSQTKWNALSPEHRKVLLAAAKEAQLYQRELNVKAQGEAMEVLRKAGVTVTEDVDRAAFQAIVAEPVKASYIKEHGAELVNAIIKAGQ